MVSDIYSVPGTWSSILFLMINLLNPNKALEMADFFFFYKLGLKNINYSTKSYEKKFYKC